MVRRNISGGFVTGKETSAHAFPRGVAETLRKSASDNRSRARLSCFGMRLRNDVALPCPRKLTIFPSRASIMDHVWV
jgi:hypothetical protein